MTPKQPPGKGTAGIAEKSPNNPEMVIIQPTEDLAQLTDSITNAINNIATTTNNHPASQNALLTTLGHLANEQDHWRRLLESGELKSKTWFVADGIKQIAEMLPPYDRVQVNKSGIIICYTPNTNLPITVRAYWGRDILSYYDNQYSVLDFLRSSIPIDTIAIAIGLTLK